jgi:hypothetical protein
MKDEHVHLTPDQVGVLLDGSLSPEAIRLAVRVLLADCPLCMETVRQRVLEPAGPGLKRRSETPE